MTAFVTMTVLYTMTALYTVAAFPDVDNSCGGGDLCSVTIAPTVDAWLGTGINSLHGTDDLLPFITHSEHVCCVISSEDWRLSRPLRIYGEGGSRSRFV
jgi:hypothetical protein